MFEILRDGEPRIAASNIAGRSVVGLAAGIDRGVIQLATGGAEPEGVTLITASQGQGVAVYAQGNTCLAVAAATIANGDPVGVVGATSSLGIAASGLWRVGKSLEAAVPGDTFAFFVNPRKIAE